MKIFNYVKGDMATSFSRKSLITVAVLAVIMLIPICGNISMLEKSGTLGSSSIGEYILLLFMGAAPFDISSRYFPFPITWIMACSVLLLVNVNYTDNIFSVFGSQFTVRSRSRKRLWGIKFLSLVLGCIIQLLVFYLAAAVFAAILGAELTLHVSADFADIFFYDNDPAALASMSGGGRARIMLLPALTLLTCNVVQSVLRLFVKPAVSFIAVMCLLLVSLYFFSPLLIGSFAMFSRIAPLLADGLTVRQALISNGAVMAICYAVGAVRMSRTDFI